MARDSDDAASRNGHRAHNGQARPASPRPQRPTERRAGGRATPRPAPRPADELPSLRRRSPLAYWVAVLVLAGMVATLLGGVIASFTR